MSHNFHNKNKNIASSQRSAPTARNVSAEKERSRLLAMAQTWERIAERVGPRSASR
jgi:hypothetical protein